MCVGGGGVGEGMGEGTGVPLGDFGGGVSDLSYIN